VEAAIVPRKLRSPPATSGIIRLLKDALRAEASERKQAEESLREARVLLSESTTRLEGLATERTEKLRETIANLEAFSSGIAHDLRAPLRTIRGFAKLLQEDSSYKFDANGKDYLRRIIAGAERMDRLIQDVLTYSRVSRSEFDLVAVDLRKLLRGVVDSDPLLQMPRADIELQGPFPNVMGNESALVQCLSNLLGNAVKFVAPNTLPQVQVWARQLDGHVRVFVHDNGIGVPREGRDKIFAMFQRLSPAYEGTGIGLAVCKKVMDRVGGSIDCESEPGHGSTFSIQLNAPANAGLAQAV
jgi:signal transduction histidine kinase